MSKMKLVPLASKYSILRNMGKKRRGPLPSKFNINKIFQVISGLLENLQVLKTIILFETNYYIVFI